MKIFRETKFGNKYTDLPNVIIFHGIIMGYMKHLIDYSSTILIYIQGLFSFLLVFLQTLSIFLAIDIYWKYNNQISIKI